MSDSLLAQLKKALGAAAILSFVGLMGMSQWVRSNPDHWTARFPHSMRISNELSYMTAAQQDLILAFAAAFFVSVTASIWLRVHFRDSTDSTSK
jgi:hypothetical protein